VSFAGLPFCAKEHAARSSIAIMVFMLIFPSFPIM